MTEHILKLNERYYEAVANGIKKFEIRKADRDFKVGDTLRLRKIESEHKYFTDADLNKSKTCNEIIVKVLYILYHNDFPDGIPEGYCVMSIKVIK